MEDVLTDEKRERGLERLQEAVRGEMDGNRTENLWAELLVMCGFVSEHVNRLVQEFSDFISEGSPKADLMEYRGLLLMKTEHHRHLLMALLRGSCFMNGRLGRETSITLFDNEERLAGILAVSSCLIEPLLEGVVQKAGSLMQIPRGMEQSVEELSNLDKFFALTKEAPFCLARAIADGCQEVLSGNAASTLQEEFQIFQKLYSLAHGMLSASEQRREHLKLHHHREANAIHQFRICDWIYDLSFLSMWDTILHSGTRMLVRAMEMEINTAKQLVYVCISASSKLFTTLNHILESEVGQVIDLDDIPERFRDVQSLADQYLCTIIAYCFDKKKKMIGDEDLKKFEFFCAKNYCCYEAIFDLLYKYEDDSLQLLHLMVHWDSLHRKNPRNSLTYRVFSKWLGHGSVKDLEHLLKGPSSLDSELVRFLQDHEKMDLVILIQTRMGQAAEARRTLITKGSKLSVEEKTQQFLLAYADPTKDELVLMDQYLEFQLMMIQERFELKDFPLDALVMVRALLDRMKRQSIHEEERHQLIKAVVDIFCCKSIEFIVYYNEEWKQLWRYVGLCIKQDADLPGSSTGGFHYPHKNLKLVITAYHKLKLSIEERILIFQEINEGLQGYQNNHHHANEGSITNLLASILDIPLPMHQ